MITLAKTWKELEEIQPVVLRMLENSIKKERLAHAYLFEGMRGTGKRETGILLAKSLFCLSQKEDLSPVMNAIIANGLIMAIILIFTWWSLMGSRSKNSKFSMLQEEFSKDRCRIKAKVIYDYSC